LTFFGKQEDSKGDLTIFGKLPPSYFIQEHFAPIDSGGNASHLEDNFGREGGMNSNFCQDLWSGYVVAVFLALQK